ncbi:hypothetical protein GUITHDRAFT_163614 [Guillardia theta CCMP2712]|uniref:Uncharacterized protein n=1 Tax=Guillardia theta (strain CCMP2712) TaxID=905079 RepID=L1J892_GUITC|nr:hypothetical protein GUITHDRAFT_163614 [Guillardia theta CCMP2712]EKX44304.1 hypothetical protein GUITHDRAFT_163614 [Guillardia theta CCMP2712]|eukprot:XP_005831284.1 hypothetical protein GUITHDRAFT_163614 [Guillardia theta CCMP2712]
MLMCLRTVLTLLLLIADVAREVVGDEGTRSGRTGVTGACTREKLIERRRNKRMDVEEEKPIILALPGPLFPPIDFDHASEEEGPKRGRYLKGEPHVDSSDHAEQTAGSIWDCSLVLAKYLEKHSQRYLKDHHVLELGSGQGVVGIACGLAGAKKVTLSDVNAALHCLRDNAVLNELESVVKVKELDWLRAHDHVRDLEPADLIVAADVVWIDQLVGPFVKTLTLAFEASKAVLKEVHVILCHKTRSNHTDNILFELLRESNFSWKEEPIENCHEEYRSSEIRIFHIFRS